MKSAAKLILNILVVLVIVAGVGGFVGWYFSGGGSLPTPDTASTSVRSAAPSAPPDRPAPRDPAAPTAAWRERISAPVGTNGTASIQRVFDTNVPTGWEDKIDDVLGSETDDREKARELFLLFPNMPPDVQAEAAQHLANLVTDTDYNGLAKMLADPKTAEPVQDILMADVLNRPNSVKLPLLLQVASAPDNAKASEAKDLLELYLDEDDGTDWAKWQARMQQWLKDNPD